MLDTTPLPSPPPCFLREPLLSCLILASLGSSSSQMRAPLPYHVERYLSSDPQGHMLLRATLGNTRGRGGVLSLTEDYRGRTGEGGARPGKCYQ